MATNVLRTDVIEWPAVPGADGYEIAINPRQGEPEWVGIGNVLEYPISEWLKEMASGEVYYLVLRAKLSSDPGPESEVFDVLLTDALTKPVLSVQ